MLLSAGLIMSGRYWIRTSDLHDVKIGPKDGVSTDDERTKSGKTLKSLMIPATQTEWHFSEVIASISTIFGPKMDRADAPSFHRHAMEAVVEAAAILWQELLT
jgi:hypothetical protein